MTISRFCILTNLPILFFSYYFSRTKDSHWVAASLEHSVPEALDFARGYGHDIKLIAEKVCCHICSFIS